MSLPKAITELSDALGSLPGIGPKLSSRLALYLSVSAKNNAEFIKNSITKVLQSINQCELCGNVTESEKCEICNDSTRDSSIIFVVEDPLDLYSIETTGAFHGIYHVLNGVISPLNGIGPEDINLKKLIQRLSSESVEEVILGMNPNVEGDATSMYIKAEIQKIVGKEIKVTRLAKGIPGGSDIEFVSTQTIIYSLRSRKLAD